jgi:hypothetical protein
MRYVLYFFLIVAALVTSFSILAAEDASVELTIKDHQFTPAVLTVPADNRIRLTIKNLDSTPAEFESKDFKAEKVVPAGGAVSLYIGPLKVGSYSFFDEFHADQTKGTLIAK